MKKVEVGMRDRVAQQRDVAQEDGCDDEPARTCVIRKTEERSRLRACSGVRASEATRSRTEPT